MYESMPVYQISIPVSLSTYLMSLNKYGYHITNMSHKAIMLHGHTDPIFLCMCA